MFFLISYSIKTVSRFWPRCALKRETYSGEELGGLIRRFSWAFRGFFFFFLMWTVFKVHIHWIIEKSREFQKNIYFWFIDCAKTFDCVDHNKLWKILKEKRIPDLLTCLLRSLYAGQKTTVRTGYGTRDWFQIGWGVCQGCILSPCLFNLYAEYIMRNARLDEA